MVLLNNRGMKFRRCGAYIKEIITHLRHALTNDVISMDYMK